MPENPSSASSSSSPSAPSGAAVAPDDALVKQVADRVYRMLLQELQVDHERLRLVTKKSLADRFRKGGR
jgi:hypothetical protein